MKNFLDKEFSEVYENINFPSISLLIIKIRLSGQILSYVFLVKFFCS